MEEERTRERREKGREEEGREGKRKKEEEEEGRIVSAFYILQGRTIVLANVDQLL